MSFLSPLALLFLLLVPVLVLLYFLKLKRPRVEAPSTLIWQKVIEDMRVNSPFQRLKRNLLLLLQLLALLALIFALARPLLRVPEKANRSTIVLLDNSASMLAKEDRGRTRLDLAKDAALKLAADMRQGDEMMLVAFNSRASIAVGFTDNRRMLKEAISAVKPTECSTKIGPALLLAQSVVTSRNNPRIVLLSDGAFPNPGNIELPVEVEYQKIGTPRPNLAITRLDIRRFLSERSRIEMFVAVQNFSKAPFAGNMTVDLDGKTLDSKRVSVGPEETLSQIFEAVLPAGGNIKVELGANDALDCDNRAWKVVLPPVSRKVLVVGDQSFFLERVFGSSPGVEYKSIAPAEYDAEEAAGYSAVVWNNVPSPEIARCDSIYLGCVPRIAGLTAGSRIDSPDIMDWDNAHPVNRFIDYNNLVIAAATRLTLPEQAVTLLRSSSTPLIALLESDRGAVCVVGFDSMRSNWPLLISFPLFLNNCLDYFEERVLKRRFSSVGAGDTLTVSARSGPPAIELPSGGRLPMSRNPAGDYSFPSVDACGIYRIHNADGGVISVAANLFDREESMLRVEENPPVGGKPVKPVSIAKRMSREFWRYLVMAAALALLLEWFVYHRRIFV